MSNKALIMLCVIVTLCATAATLYLASGENPDQKSKGTGVAAFA